MKNAIESVAFHLAVFLGRSEREHFIDRHDDFLHCINDRLPEPSLTIELLAIRDAWQQWLEDCEELREEWFYSTGNLDLPSNHLAAFGDTSDIVRRYRLLMTRTERFRVMLSGQDNSIPKFGVSLRDIGVALEYTGEDLSDFVKRFSDSGKVRTKPIGKCPNKRTAKLYELSEILADFQDFSPTGRGELQRIRKHLDSVRRHPAK